MCKAAFPCVINYLNSQFTSKSGCIKFYRVQKDRAASKSVAVSPMEMQHHQLSR